MGTQAKSFQVTRASLGQVKLGKIGVFSIKNHELHIFESILEATNCIRGYITDPCAILDYIHGSQ